MGPSLGFPNLLSIKALICLAGEGGGKGRLKNLLGVDLAGDGETPTGSGLGPSCGYGLGQRLVLDDLAGVLAGVAFEAGVEEGSGEWVMVVGVGSSEGMVLP